VRRTGAAVDGGLDCTACHRTYAPANSDPRGRLTIQASPYVPGVKQAVRVQVEHPEGARWGFQLTARLGSDETKPAGTFTVTADVRVRCDGAGADAPCSGATEFASHFRTATSDSTGPGSSGSRTFEIEWMPPATDAGPVVFYAAGNVANNNNANSEDRIYTTRLRLSAACALTGRPTLTANGVVNAGSYTPALAANTLVSIFGTGLAGAGTARIAASFDYDDGRFPRELACVGVEIAGQRAPVLYVSPTQINAQVPTINLSGPVKVEVILNPGRPGEARGELNGVPIQAAAPALFTFNGRAIAALHPNNDVVGDPASLRFDRPVRPARPGDVVSLFGTGFGATNPAAQAGEIPAGQAVLTSQVAITVGGLVLTAADVLYAGAAPTLISGVYQFNVRIPPTTSDGDVPVVIRVGSVQSQDRATILVRRQ